MIDMADTKISKMEIIRYLLHTVFFAISTCLMLNYVFLEKKNVKIDKYRLTIHVLKRRSDHKTIFSCALSMAEDLIKLFRSLRTRGDLE